MQGQRSSTIVVIAAGEADRRVLEHLPRGAAVVAADGGVDTASALGLGVTVAVGDFDSVSDAGLRAAERAGARLVRHRTEKDATDLELALDEALALGGDHVAVVCRPDGRLDHLTACLAVLGHERYRAVEIDAYLGAASVHVIRAERELAGVPEELVSLLPLHGPAEGIVTEGLRYPLRGETLAPGSSRGISNVFEARTARIRVGRGVLLAVRPGGTREEMEET